MDEAMNYGACERAEDLISFLYGELDAHEAKSFEAHRRECPACESDLAALGPVRQSIRAWRDHSLGFASAAFAPNVSAPQQQKRSALAAIGAFFELSPLWMKGATGFAALLALVLVAFATSRLLETTKPASPQSAKAHSEKEFSEAVDKEVQARLAVVSKKENRAPAVAQNGVGTPNGLRKTNMIQPANSSPPPRKLRNPLTRAEREQLAADLRLISDDDDDALQLLTDRINR